jgi:hypothetical protein
MKWQPRRIIALGFPAALLASVPAFGQTTTTTTIKKAERPVAPLAPPPPAPPAPVLQMVAPGVIVDGVLLGNAGANNRQAQLAQMIEQLRPYLRVEYHFLRVVCVLTPDQRMRIARDGEREFRDAVSEYYDRHRSPQFRKAGEAPRPLPDPHKLIQEALARAAEDHLTPEQADRYRQEIVQRAEDHKHAVIQNLVATLAQMLVLSGEQRAQLTDRLGARWDDAWFPTDFMMANSDRYLSRVPKQEILSLLSEDQRKLWELNNAQPNVSGIVQVFPVNNAGFPEDEELAAAREAAASDKESTP